MKLYRVTTTTKGNTTIRRAWANNENEIIETYKALAPFTTIESITEITANTLIIKK